jgi:hypothetical protein
MQNVTLSVTRHFQPPSPHISSSFSTHDPSLDAESQASTHCPNKLPKTIRLASILYLSFFQNPPIPISSPANHETVTILAEELESPMNDEIWLQYPGIPLWILLVGAAVSEGREEGPFFVHFLVKVDIQSRWGWWEELNGASETWSLLTCQDKSEGVWTPPGA